MGFFRIRGLRVWDTLALWVNGLFWWPRRLYFLWRYKDKTQAWKALLQKPHRHWLVWPFRLEGRFYRWPGVDFWADAQSLVWFSSRQYQDLRAEWVETRLRSGRVGLDIGAHHGFWTLYHANKFPPQAKVILAEPHPANFAYLVQNLALNKAFYAVPLPLAMWKEPTSLTIEMPAGVPSFHASYSAAIRQAVSDGASSWQVPATTIDAVVSCLGLETVDWIKIDAEGAEVAILEGARQTLTRFAPSLWMEVHDTWEPVLALLDQLGYVVRDQVRFEDPEGLYPTYGYLWAEKTDPTAIL